MHLFYLGFAVLLVGVVPSLIATQQIWAIAANGQLHVGGLCNRTWRPLQQNYRCYSNHLNQGLRLQLHQRSQNDLIISLQRTLK